MGPTSWSTSIHTTSPDQYEVPVSVRTSTNPGWGVRHAYGKGGSQGRTHRPGSACVTSWTTPSFMSPWLQQPQLPSSKQLLFLASRTD